MTVHDSIRKSKCLVTGGAGFIGSHLCQALLKQEFQVVCFDNFTNGSLENLIDCLGNPNFTLLRGDLRNPADCLKAVEQVDYVFHLAAIGSVPRSIADPILYAEVNIVGFLNLLEAVREHTVSKFVYASSSSVYGDSDRMPHAEENTGQVLSPYALTKKIGEEYSRLYWYLYKVPTVGLRYFNVFGPRQNPKGPYAAVIPKFIYSSLRNESVPIYDDGQQRRDFTYVQDVIKATILAASSDCSENGQVFNVSGGETHSILEVHRLISSKMELNIAPVFFPSRKGDVRNSAADLTKIRTHLGYIPNWDLSSGLDETIHWFRSHSSS